MTRKRKSNLSQRSNSARAKKGARFNETFLQAELRRLELAECSDVESGAYAQKLLGIGKGHLDTDQEGMVLFIHQFCHVVESEDELIDQDFPNMQQHILDEKWLCERTILAPKNETVVKINKKILGEIASDSSVYNSIDTVMSSDDSTNYPVEFLNSLDLSGVPLHKLEWKVGVPVLLMRNLDAPRLCNDGDRFNSCQVIYSQFGLAIHQNDHQARRRFVEWARNEIAVVPDFHKRILFSDEAHFWLNGYVNKQNCRIWSEANPQVYVETPLHPEKLTVWCALWAGGILLQKR
ncbi:ATP-dependent DNA helicase [Trichonephila clavipes]|nr:ATP-dependent DNA helicase [Trichonephila clavipes]